MKNYSVIGIESKEELNESYFGFGISDNTLTPNMNEPDPIGGGTPPPSSGACVVKTGIMTACSSCMGPGSGQAQQVYNLRTNLYSKEKK